MSLATAVGASPSVETMSVASTAGGVDDPAHDIIFTDLSALFSHLETLQDVDALVVGDVTAANFRTIEEQRDASGRKYHLFYFANVGRLIITLPTFEHVRLHFAIYSEIKSQIVLMGVHESWMDTLDARYSQPSPNNSSGEGDSSGYPEDQRDLGDWPTLVVEGGYTQTMASLRAKMRWWFAASDHKVKVVILVKMGTPEAAIHIEKWAETIQRPGGPVTRWAAASGLALLQPSVEQVVDVLWCGLQPLSETPRQHRNYPALFYSVNGPLVVGFQSIFLRNPVGREHDFVISDRILMKLAADVYSNPHV